jgi:hypothetical protein
MDMVRIFDPPPPLQRCYSTLPHPQGIYTKIFLQFPYKFWFDTEVCFKCSHHLAGS